MLFIDARKAYDAGIGTYIRELIPRVLLRMYDQPCTILLSESSLSWFAELQSQVPQKLKSQIISAPPFSISEQFILRSYLNCKDLFWATSLSHPLHHDCPLVVTVHDVAQLALPSKFFRDRLTKVAIQLFFKSINRSAQELLFVSHFTQSEYNRLVASPTQTSTVTPLGVNANWFNSSNHGPSPNNKPYFISVSSIRPHKNFEFLLKAFEAVVDKIPHQLVIVGDDQGLKRVDVGLTSLIKRLGNRVRFLGRIPDAALKTWVANAEAMVFPSLYEGFGLPPIEAMAAGCPVLSSSAGALKEVCGNAAQYFDPYNSESLQRCLLDHSNIDSVEKKLQIELGVRRAQDYTWDKTADLTVLVLLRVLDSLNGI